DGNTLCQVENPDHTIIHKIEKCSDCGFNLELEEVVQYDCRQVFDLRSEEHTSELQSLTNIVCRLLLEKKKKTYKRSHKSENVDVNTKSLSAGRRLRQHVRRSHCRMYDALQHTSDAHIAV